MKKLFITFILLITIIGFCGCAHDSSSQVDSSDIVSTTTVEAAKTTIPKVTTITETNIVTTNGASPEITIEEIVPEEFIVYKPSTHYVHRSTCYWVTSECYQITDTSNIEARLCDECNPNIEIINPYIEPQVITTTTTTSAIIINPTSITEITDYEYQLLAEIVDYEAGASCINLYNKAKIVAGIMNRVNDSRFPSTIYGVLTQPGQFASYYPGCKNPSQICYDAVDYYFSHKEEFNNDNSWYGDGYQNHFYYS